jgi:shikimate kinase
VNRDAPRPAARPDAHVVLVGLMGVGKSTVGRRLAKELERPFADADEQVELRAGRAIPAIFREDGEEAFRRLESEVLADLVGRDAPLVIAAGGGVVSRAQNRATLAGRTTVVWLRASAGFLAARTDPTHRPLLAEDAERTLSRLLAEREPLYAAVADLVVDVEPFHVGDEKPKRALARHIAALLAEHASAPETARNVAVDEPVEAQP